MRRIMITLLAVVSLPFVSVAQTTPPATLDAEQSVAEAEAATPPVMLDGEPSVAEETAGEAATPPAALDEEQSVAEDVANEEVVEAQLESVPLETFDQRRRDEVWTVSSRHVGSIHCPTQSLKFQRRIDGGDWRTESAASFFAGDRLGPPRHTLIFVHGNRTPQQEAMRRGLQTYDQMFLEWKEAPSVRFIIWMWPADQIPGQIRDVRVKAERADEHAFHLARFLCQLPDQNATVIGYSFGGRLSVGAMHLVGGGALCGYRLPERNQMQTEVSLSLVVPAIRNDCFVTTRCHALEHTGRLFLLYNTEDRYLSLYRYLKLDDFTPALGGTGVCGVTSSGIRTTDISQYNAATNVGQDHDYLEYVVDKRIEQRIRANLYPVMQSGLAR